MAALAAQALGQRCEEQCAYAAAQSHTQEAGVAQGTAIQAALVNRQLCAQQQLQAQLRFGRGCLACRQPHPACWKKMK